MTVLIARHQAEWMQIGGGCHFVYPSLSLIHSSSDPLITLKGVITVVCEQLLLPTARLSKGPPHNQDSCVGGPGGEPEPELFGVACVKPKCEGQVTGTLRDDLPAGWSGRSWWGSPWGGLYQTASSPGRSGSRAAASWRRGPWEPDMETIMNLKDMMGFYKETVFSCVLYIP